MVKIVIFLLFLLNDFIIKFFQHIHPLGKHLLKSKKKRLSLHYVTQHIFFLLKFTDLSTCEGSERYPSTHNKWSEPLCADIDHDITQRKV